MLFFLYNKFMLSIRKSTYDDLDRIKEILVHARQYMKESGNPTQWGDNRPSISLIENDIQKGNSYVVVDENEVVATFAFIVGEDPTYLDIDGKWLNDFKYGTIHRIASNGKVKGIFPFVINELKKLGIDIRIDTHINNKTMIHQIEKAGFKYCGVIVVDDGTKRNAYQLLRKVLVIVGPTAVGKTSFAIKCANEFNGEVISGDSIQIYEGLDIGSAKATLEERKQAKHYLIDIKKPNENYSVKEFQDLGRHYIDEISSNNKLPIICGGTGLYIKACLYDFKFFDEEEKDNPYDELSNKQIYDMLIKVDPEALKNIHINNRKRLVRALNVYNKHLKGISVIKDEQSHKPVYDCLIVGLTKDRDELYSIIDKRIDKMIDDGLIDEIQGLLDKGVNFENQSMQGIGYKEFKDYFEGTMSLKECVDRVKNNTHHFVKRQYTYFNNQMNINWFTDKNDALALIKKWSKNEI